MADGEGARGCIEPTSSAFAAAHRGRLTALPPAVVIAGLAAVAG